MSRNSFVRIAFGVVLGLAAGGVGVAAGGESPAQRGAAVSGVPMSVPTTTGVMELSVDRPDANDAIGRTISTPSANKAKAAATGATVRLTSRVILRADRPELVAALRGKALAGGLRPLLAGRGYWVVETTSVRDAVALADVLRADPHVREAAVDIRRPWALRSPPNDPKFPNQWHLVNEDDPLFDVNADTAWNAGYTGDGVVIGIVEDAWQHGHPDLFDNYLPEASQVGGSITSHATSCAGVAAAVANNELMGVGVAYGAWLSDQIFGTDQQTADALAFRNDLNDIKSNSWGPPDIGHADVMPSVIRAAIEEGIDSGRDGLGEIYVWAAGNGGTGDRVDYDPFVSSRYTIAVGSIGDQDRRASYNESGSSMFVVTESSGNIRGIGTTTSNSGWTSSFGGTSAASPLAAGVVALMLQANPTLTWRDVQHVLVESARMCDPNQADWSVNGAGYAINPNYGFGAIDAGAAVALARDWVNVPHEIAVDTGVVPVNEPIPDNDATGVDVAVEIDRNIRIETVELILNVQSNFIGDLEIWMTGPSGVRSTFAKSRFSDGQHNYTNYVFTSFRHWGEGSVGTWTIHIADRAAPDPATWIDYRLVFHGTPACPGDLNDDGLISMADIQALLLAYGAGEGDPEFIAAGDLDNNRRIGLGDLARLLAVFGQTCE